MRPLRILALVPNLYDTSPGQRFRIEQWAPRLAEHGIDIEFSPFETPALGEVLYAKGQWTAKAAHVVAGLRRRLSEMRRVSCYDGVYVFREAALLGPALVERWLSAAGVPFVFDFDDAVFEPYVSPSNGRLSLLKFPGKTRTVCRLAGHVMAGNPYLEAWARRYNRRVTMVPTTIDVERYVPSLMRAEQDPPVIGWSGSYSTAQHLSVVNGALTRLAAQRRFRLVVVGAPGYEVPGVDVRAVPWRADTEVQELSGFDIGIMPLPDDRWSRGKCGLKALQYMALGVPAVCSPVGVNVHIIAHGKNGMLAASEDEWVATLARLLDSPAQRYALGQAGRRTVVERYSASVQAPVVARILREIGPQR